MKYFKTLYIGCNDNGEIATPGVHETKYVNKRNTRGHMEIMNYLAYPFIHSQRLYEMKVLNKPLKFCFLIEDRLSNFKFKEENIWTQLESILYFLESYQPPDNGLILSLYFVEKAKNYDQASLTSLWPFKKDMQWIGDGDYITFHFYEPNNNPKNIHMNDTVTKNGYKQYIHSEVGEVVKEIDKHCIFPVKRIDYAMGEKKIFETLKHAKYHVSYNGGTYHSSGIIGCPTVGLFWKVVTQFNEEFNLNIEMGVKEVFDNTTSYGFFNYDFEKKCMYREPQKHLKHVRDKNELLSYLKGISDIIVHDKVYDTV